LRRLIAGVFVALVLALAAVVALDVVSGEDGDRSASEPLPSSGPAIASPRIGDHWHAAYAIFIGDQRQPNIPTFTGPEEIHTHGDGIIHIHPVIPAGEGSGAAISKFFQYGGGTLSSDEMRIPGQSKTYKNGDKIPGTDTGSVIRILRADSGIHPLGSGFSRALQACDAKPASDFEEVTPAYIPRDGDCIRIVFEPSR